MSAYTTADLIASVRVRGMFPDASQGSLSADNILLLATEELRLTIVPMILAVREKYYETYVDYPMVASKSIYPLPLRATGGICSLVQFIVNQAVYNLSNIDATAVATTQTGLYPRGFYFQDNNIVLYPTPNATAGTIRIRYYQRPSLLINTTASSQITALDQAAGTVTLAAAPSAWSSGVKYDFIPNVDPYSPYGVDSVLSNIDLSTNTLSFGTLPVNTDGTFLVSIGDWIAPAGQTPVPGIPSEFFPLLAQTVACKLLEAIGDPNIAVAQQKLQAYAQNAIRLITPREVFGLKKVKSDWRNF